MLSHAAVFWDDEMEEGTTGFNYQPNYDKNTFTYDTNMKFSGSGSIRLNYSPECEPFARGNVGCGGANVRSIPLTDDVYRRVYFRMSGTGPDPSGTGSFMTSVLTCTKLLRTVSTGISRQWWMIGCGGEKRWMITQENTPPGGATNIWSSQTLADNRWYCLEAREKLSDPGVANGIVESWIDGVLVARKTDIMSRLAGNTNQWNGLGIFRQTGRGNIWWDRYAAGNTRIGCLGATSASDTTRPAPPQGLVIR